MIKPGHIEITDKVRFVYHKLEKPDLDNFKKHPVWAYAEYDKAIEKYEASKQTVEVDNYYDLHEKAIRIIDARCQFENNQPCKAKINGKAEVIELIKVSYE